MPGKGKSKSRLDKYYYLAKEHGFRSRASFKLIQLNKKYNFLGNANCLLDLCAAPGGWLQVAAKYMPVSSIKIGVDLDPIKPINGVTHFQADITSEKCRFLIRKEIKHFKADVVLNDGAPNVGGNWSKDAYGQSELVLFAVKLATEFLKEDGIFVTKVFRSSDYNSLMYVLKMLFKKVEATKPQASRNESAEIFVVCLGYKNPSYIDPKILDPKYALKQLEDEEDMKMNSIKSIKAMFEKKKHRSGYSGGLVKNDKTFKEFVEATNPYQFLAEYSKIKPITDDCKKYLGTMKCPMDHKLYFEDLQILGKKEIQELIIWRNKIRSKLFKKEKKEGDGDKEDDENENKENEENKKTYKEKKFEEMDEEMNEFERARKTRLDKEKKKREKNELRMKMSFVDQQNSAGVENEVEFDQRLFEYIKKNEIDIEEMSDDEDEEDNEQNSEIPDQEVDEVDLSELSEDDYIDMMNEDITENKKLFTEERKENHKKKVQREKKKKFTSEEEDKEENKLNDGVQYVRADKDNDEEDEEDEDEFDEDEEEDEEEGEIDENSDEEFLKKNKISEKDDEEMEDIEEIEESVKEDEKDLFENPLRKKKNLQKSQKSKFNEKVDKDKKIVKEVNEEENEDSDTDEEDNNFKKNKKKNSARQSDQLKTIKLLGKKTKRENEEKNKQEDDIEFISKDNNIKDSDDSEAESEFDMDEKAEIRAIAQKMLRKKDRIEILNNTYNRFAFDDSELVPDWFMEEEKKHSRPVQPVTKEEINAQKDKLREYNSRMPKKILEAKARKRNKLQKRMEKVKVKAQAISNQDDINEFSKVKQIEKMYRKELGKNKQEKKKYVVARSNKKNVGKSGKSVKFVDSRLKKDTKALKRAEKRNKKKGIKTGGKGKKGGKTGRK